MKLLVLAALIGSAKAIETVGLHQQTPVQYGSQFGPVLYGAIGEDGLASESRTLPDENGPKMSALPTSGLKTVTKAGSFVYKANPYVYIPAIGQVAKPLTITKPEVKTVPAQVKTVPAEVRTVPEGLKPVNINPFVYTASPYVYTHPMTPIHPTQITPIVPHGFAYSFTVGNEEATLAKPEEVVSVEKREAPEAEGEAKPVAETNVHPYIANVNWGTSKIKYLGKNKRDAEAEADPYLLYSAYYGHPGYYSGYYAHPYAYHQCHGPYGFHQCTGGYYGYSYYG